MKGQDDEIEDWDNDEAPVGVGVVGLCDDVYDP